MRTAIIAVVFFSILAFDLASNDGRLLGCVQGFAQAVQREVGL
jgi:hypothetical protein